MIGCTELLKFSPDPENHKAGLLDFSLILKNALTIRPNTEILGGSVKQIFDLDKRLVSFRYRDFKEIKGRGGREGGGEQCNLDERLERGGRGFD